jgi:GTPase SAR1 family protein
VSSPVVEYLLADFRQTDRTELDLFDTPLSEEDWADLASQADAFREVEVMKVRAGEGVRPADWLNLAVRLPALRQFECSGGGADDVRAVAESLPGLTTLYLRACDRVTDDGVRLLATRLARLSALHLMRCPGVTDAGVRAAARRLSGLTTVCLRGCEQLTDAGVQAVIDHLPRLTILDLSYCHRVTGAGITAVAKHLTDLTALSLRRSAEVADAEVVAVARGLPLLTALDLRECDRVTDAGVRAIAEHLTGLTTLDLAHCHEVTDDGVLAVSRGLSRLAALYLRGCERVTDDGVLAVAEHLTGLTTLNLSACGEVTDAGVRAVAEYLTGLTTLVLSKCKRLTNDGFRAVAKHLTGLTQLNMSGCRVTDDGLQAIAEHLTGLRTLNLSGCREVTDAGLRAVAEHLTGLRELDISGCVRVTDVGVRAVAERLVGLTTLDLSGCREVTDAGVKAVAEHLTGLTSLTLYKCDRLTDAGVLAVAEHLARITSLNLSWCDRVTDTGVKAVAERLARLTALYASGLPLVGAPKELLDSSGNLTAIRAYYRRGEQEGRRQLNEAKLIVVGNEAVGKSALVNYLVHDRPCADTAKTEGVAILDRINVARWDVNAAAAGEHPLRLNVWDFGGQEVLYETHRFFLTARSVYLVVLEARRENAAEAEGVIHGWMRAIRNRGGDEAPVVVVVNKAEAPHDLRLDEPRLLKEYPAIRGFVRTSCRNPQAHPDGGKGIRDLRTMVVGVIRASLPHVRDWFPASYFRVKEEVGALAHAESMLTTARYAGICARAGVTDEAEQEALLILLDQIGVVVRHSETTLLDPNWLTTAVYRVLTHAEVVKAGGEFAVADLGRLLKDLASAPKYPPKCWPFIAEMMTRFNLSFELPEHPGRYLVPLQLPTQEPEVNWDVTRSLRFRYDYDSLPLGLLPRFIVEMHRHLTPNRTAWVSGVVLGVDGCRVLVRADRRNRKVHVWVTGPEGERRGAMAVVRAGFAKVHALHGDLIIKAMVPVDVPGNPDAAIEFDQLVTAERQKVKSFPVVGAQKPFPVKKLLEGVGPEPRAASSSPRRGARVVIKVAGDLNTTQLGIGVEAMTNEDERATNTVTDKSVNVQSQSGAKALGVTGVTATNTGDLTQHQGLDPKTAEQVVKLLDELVGLLKGMEVTKATQPKRDEAVKGAEEAKDAAKAEAPEKGHVAAAWGKVKGWVTGALSAGMFVENAAVKVKELLGRLGGLLG